MHAFAPFSDLEIFVKVCIFLMFATFFANVALILLKNAKFDEMLRIGYGAKDCIV